ncbi:hypothetical protein HV819_05420 [Anaerococcus sp. AGMB00486]|uniref:Uncharacterized protein n=2 Tax=Anaerococcus TaxID=165779 RepID=A0ABX2N9Q8_9FIRM|nr:MULTISPECIES: hypothetical protein [Anaerococcus]MSS78312.1 urea transporter [Anaerococcus porci]NVF11426.1 hypothetical protein [Anaerococcus faecalis]
MKKLSNILLRISGFYYLLISIGLILSTLFSLFVDRKYIFSIFDLLGFSNISLSLIKPIFFILLFCLFILISLLTNRIFSSIKDKKHFPSNMFAGFFLLFTSVIGHVFFRDRIFIISYIFNIFLIIGSMLGLHEKSIEYYENEGDLYNSKIDNEDKENIDNKEVEIINNNTIKKDSEEKNEEVTTSKNTRNI